MAAVIPEMNKVDPDVSTINNLLNMSENFDNLIKYLQNIDDHIVEVIGSSALQSIKDYVLNHIGDLKHNIVYNYQVNIDTPIISGGYKYTRKDAYTIEVEKVNDSNWDTKNLLVQVQSETTNQIISPIVTKYVGKFSIKFSDPMVENGRIIFL